jgi:hypothetical protein
MDEAEKEREDEEAVFSLGQSDSLEQSSNEKLEELGSDNQITLDE